MSLGPEGWNGVSCLPLDAREATRPDLAVDALCCPGNSDWFGPGRGTQPEPMGAGRHALPLPPEGTCHRTWEEPVSGVQVCTSRQAVGLEAEAR